MPRHEAFDEEELLDRVEKGDDLAVDKLLNMHRIRLKRMVRLRMDRRLTRRVDPSDVVQEALTDAAKKLREYARVRPLPVYPWLRQLAWERLIRAHRTHIRAQRRSVNREEEGPALSNASMLLLAQRFIESGTGASEQLARRERRQYVQGLLASLTSQEQELALLRYVEQLSTAEIAAVLETTTAAVKMRQLRLLRKLRSLLGDESP
jgi:RNA polymerase sigma-70 factor (ECF subfamily)